MSQVCDEARFLLKRHKSEALAQARLNLDTANFRMNGDPTYHAYCKEVVAWVEGYIEGYDAAKKEDGN